MASEPKGLGESGRLRVVYIVEYEVDEAVGVMPTPDDAEFSDFLLGILMEQAGQRPVVVGWGDDIEVHLDPAGWGVVSDYGEFETGLSDQAAREQVPIGGKPVGYCGEEGCEEQRPHRHGDCEVCDGWHADGDCPGKVPNDGPT